MAAMGTAARRNQWHRTLGRGKNHGMTLGKNIATLFRSGRIGGRAP